MKKSALIALCSITLWAGNAAADTVILDDMIINGSMCVGFDCVNGEVFNFDTLVLKENNVRILFRDTSGTSFPTTDWILQANDSSSGGAEYLGFVNADAGVMPFRVEAGAPNSALVVTDSGVGLGVNPATALHIFDSDTPTIRIEQNGLAGWPAQTWDVGANESNFFVRDSTFGGEIPLRIFTGAPSNALVITGSGGVGIGTDVPAGTLHLVSAVDFVTTDPDVAQLIVANSFAAGAMMVSVQNAGTIRNSYTDTAAGTTWVETFGADPIDGTNRAWTLREMGSGIEAVGITQAGNMRIAGTLSQGSSRTIKEGIRAVRADDILAAVAALEVSRWQYVGDANGGEHLGPMAEDFYSAFGLGADNRHIAPADMAGVAVSSVQALNRLVRQQAEEIASVKRDNARLEQRLQHIESLLTAR